MRKLGKSMSIVLHSTSPQTHTHTHTHTHTQREREREREREQNFKILKPMICKKMMPSHSFLGEVGSGCLYAV
jgi:hypothetical protein